MDEHLFRDLKALTGAMEREGWREVRVAGPNMRVLLSMDAQGNLERPQEAVPVAAQPMAASAQTGQREVPPQRDALIDIAWIAVQAPNLGTFYRSPKPGAAAFVEIGQRVVAGAELCLIEVMKLFTSVRADVAGTVRHIAVADGALVEGGQPLIYIESD